ncbi:adenylate cyclase type 4 isoform X2 [Ceratitis capitata]|uniref:adenylate cyclase type 4 isoform X2 n=1 Tax=Ceratitis capitata TaxID=7213 RepID=UPI000A103166|nr:adenylate cyclase type 4 isoform X2 [Ceratitis capitata]
MYSNYEKSRKLSVTAGTILDDVTFQFGGKFELNVLREQCKKLDVEKVYNTYMKRLRRNQLYTFLAVLVVITTIYCLMLMPFKKATIDICIYIGFTFAAVVILFFSVWKKSIAKITGISHIKFLGVLLLSMMDIAVPVLHAVNQYDTTIPLYYSFIISSIYIFMPFSNNVFPLMLGIVVSVAYFIMFHLVIYRINIDGNENFEEEKVISEVIFMSAINLLGLFFRLLCELAIRRTFIDKRQCVEEDLLLQAAKTQEKILLLSMIPAQIADKIEEDIMLRLSRSTTVRRRSIYARESELLHRKLFIETHNDVTILYADMVNYTKLTTTLDVKTLVETLHDLYVKFDDAALELDVLRIQFLGDCYYCVANVSIPNEEHAASCVKLGLRMIKEIHRERDARHLEMDIRVGVHSGSVFTGVIGAKKWKFDIYSKDVEIANRLESTGVPGRVHISDDTLELLNNQFKYEQGTEKALTDKLLQLHSVKTFLIVSMTETRPVASSASGLINKLSLLRSSSMSSFQDLKSVYSVDVIQKMVNLEMRRESITIPVETLHYISISISRLHRIFFGKTQHLSRFEREEHNFRVNFSWLFMCFKNWRWEHNYLIQPDVQLKYSVLVSYIVMLSTIAIQTITAPQSILFWILVLVGNICMLLILCLVWYKRIWEMCRKEWFHIRPRNKFGRWMYWVSEASQKELSIRISIYLGILALQLCYTLINMLDCNRFQVENEEIEVLLFDDGTKNTLCFDTWAVTECIVMSLLISFLFSGITYIIKMCVGLIILMTYITIILLLYDFIYERSSSTNINILPEYTHIFVSCISLVAFHLISRQKEFIARVDYYWKRELKKKQENAKLTNETISRLVGNILPTHIVDIYMDNQLSNKLYYEEYSNVAVLFATILNFDIEVVGMRVLNEIICDFDGVLSTFKGVYKIEKIKVAGWTYMAACGLNTTGTGHRGSVERHSSTFSFALNFRRESVGEFADKEKGSANKQENLSELFGAAQDSEKASATSITRRRSVRMFNDEEEPIIDDDVVFVMARFGMSLLRAMSKFNKHNLYNDKDNPVNGDLRIGIANGPVMAGVVGLYKPHYDIWGNAVNMASRMDSTGVANTIQVTEETANILKQHEIKCRYRGITNVKGRGPTPTYFVDIDKHLKFRRTRTDETEPQSELS